MRFWGKICEKIVPPGHRFSCYIGGTCGNIAVHLTFLREKFIHLAPKLFLSHSPLSFFSAPNLALCFSEKTEPSLAWLHQATPSLFQFLPVLSRVSHEDGSLFFPQFSVFPRITKFARALDGLCIRATNLLLSSLCHNVHAGDLCINTHLMLKILTFSHALFQKYLSEDACGCCFDVQAMLLHGRSSSSHTYLNILSFLTEHVFPYTYSPGPGADFMPGMLSSSEAGSH